MNSMVIFHSYVNLYHRIYMGLCHDMFHLSDICHKPVFFCVLVKLLMQLLFGAHSL